MNLESLTRKRDYYEKVAPIWIRIIWTRQQAFDYFIKYNKRRLTKEGGILKIGRDYFIDSNKFPKIAVEILDLQRHLSEGSYYE